MKSQNVEEIKNDIATQIETNTKTMMILFDERKEMILKLMAMVEELQPIVVKQHEAIQILAAEIMRLRADKANNPAIYRPKSYEKTNTFEAAVFARRIETIKRQDPD